MHSSNRGCARLGSEVAPPLGVVIEEVAILIALVRRHRRAVGAAVRRAVDDEVPGMVEEGTVFLYLDWTRQAAFDLWIWTRQAVGQQHNNNTPAPYVLEVRRAVAQLLLVNRAGRELLHLSMWFPNSSTERENADLIGRGTAAKPRVMLRLPIILDRPRTFLNNPHIFTASARPSLSRDSNSPLSNTETAIFDHGRHRRRAPRPPPCTLPTSLTQAAIPKSSAPATPSTSCNGRY